MKRKYLLIAAFASALIVVFYTIVKANSAGATYGVCGAPDDQVPDGSSCGYQGCHGITPITNSDALKITLIDQSTSQPVTSYELGKKYTVEIELTYRTLIACGFESEVELPKSPYTHEGKIAAGTRSQIPSGPKGQYATHINSLRAGTHYGMWEYTWTAPTNYIGDLIIYAAGNSANGDGTNFGDTIFTTKMTISHNAAIDPGISGISKMNIFPNPAKDYFSIGCTLANEENMSIVLYNLKGQAVKSIQSGILPQGENKISSDVKGLPTGLYFIRMTANGETATEKVMVGE